MNPRLGNWILMVVSALVVVVMLTHPPYDLWVLILYGFTSLILACTLIFGKRAPDT